MSEEVAQLLFLLGREEAVRLVKAARAVAAQHPTELPAGYTLVPSDLLKELRDALPEIAL